MVAFQARRLRFSVFHLLADLPLRCPFLKIAFVKWSYRQQPKFGYCPVPDSGKLKLMSEQSMDMAESVLKYAHVDMKSVVDGFTAFVRAQVLGNMDVAVVTALLKLPKKSTAASVEEAIRGEVSEVLLRVKKLALGKQFPPLPFPFSAEDLEEKVLPQESSEEQGKQASILPKVIKYDENGAPLNDQDKVEVIRVQVWEHINWNNWFDLADVQGKMQIQMAKCAVFHAMVNVFGKTAKQHFDLRLERQGSHIQVLASKDMPVGALKLTVVAAGFSSLVESSQHPHAVEVSYCHTSENGRTTTQNFFVNPDFSVPKPSAVAGALPEWTPKHRPFMFWGIKRNHEEDKWNCEIEPVNVNLVLAAGMDDSVYFAGEEPISYASFVALPVLVNTRAIRKGEEVVLRCTPPALKEKQTKVRTWQTDVGSVAKKPKPSN